MTQEDFENQQRKIAAEHTNAIKALNDLMALPQGKTFLKYLLKHLEALELPEVGLTGDLLMDKLGSLRAGNSILKMMCEANFEIAGTLIAQTEKDKYEELLSAHGRK